MNDFIGNVGLWMLVILVLLDAWLEHIHLRYKPAALAFLRQTNPVVYPLPGGLTVLWFLSLLRGRRL